MKHGVAKHSAAPRATCPGSDAGFFPFGQARRVHPAAEQHQPNGSRLPRSR
ncbi:hypothetical protein P4123_13210 [Pseudomonas aeruginosa]|nr:hypothetical protein [Pseudomonas aeruginosa]